MSKKRAQDVVEQAPEQASTPEATAELQDCIRHRAYELWEQRGGTHGCHEDDWLQAEREVLAERAGG